VNPVKSFSDFLYEDKIGSFYNDELNPKFWDKQVNKDGDVKYEFDPIVRKKLLKISDDFFSKFGDIINGAKIEDIQLTGSLANFNYTDFSDLDVHVLINFSDINAPKDVLKAAIDGIRFIWNLRHDVIIRGHDVELYMQDSKEPHTSSGLFSLKNNEWIKKPSFNPPTIDEQDLQKKFDGIASDINQLETKLLLVQQMPSNAKDLYTKANKVKEKLQKMRKEDLSKGGEFSIGNLAFKKLRNEGYIEKLIDIISGAYGRIYSE
jgi:hypothetical protein